MQKKKLLLLVSLFTTIASISFAAYCCGLHMNNYRCVHYGFPHVGATCSDGSEHACTMSLGRIDACIQCASDSAVPRSGCVQAEGVRCELSGQAGTNCGNVARKRATCTKKVVAGLDYYSCDTYWNYGTCDSSNNYIDCIWNAAL